MENRASQKIKILFVAANSKIGYLRMDKEIQEIQKKIRASEHRDLLDVIPTLNTSPADLVEALSQHKPHIVHFCAHGYPSGEIQLIGSDDKPRPMSEDMLRKVFTALKDNVRVVVLNACYSQKQAQAITSIIDCAIGMSDVIGDNAAIAFAATFYSNIGYGRSLQEAFDVASVVAEAETGYVKELKPPVLLTRPGVKANSIYVILPPKLRAMQEIQEQQKQIRKLLVDRAYDSVYYQIDHILRNYRDDISSEQLAQLKYMEALVHLEGKRPSSHSPSVIKTIENLLRQAISHQNLFSYYTTLAVFKKDFGLPQHKKDAQSLLDIAFQLSQVAEDYENFSLLKSCQPTLFHEYQHCFHI